MIVIIRSNEVNPDPRVQKYIDFLERKSIEYIMLGWNRNGNKINKKNYFYFERQAKYGQGIRNIPNKLLWFIFVIKYLIKNRKQHTIVHACDFDAAFPAYIASLVTNNKYIFDVFDWMSDDSKQSLIRKLLGIFERHIAKKTDYVIVCEEERKNQLNIPGDQILVMPNIPNINFTKNVKVVEEMNKQRSKYDLIVSYVGVFDSNRGIEDILKLAKRQSRIFFNFAGFGRLEDLVKESASQNRNIKYWGKVSYNIGLNIMKESDLIMAMYYLSNPIHRYAAPNKFYEGLMLGVPIITTKGTLVGNKSIGHNTGFVIGEGMESLNDLLTMDFLIDEISEKADNAKVVWDNFYKDAINKFMDNIYLDIIKQ